MAKSENTWIAPLSRDEGVGREAGGEGRLPARALTLIAATSLFGLAACGGKGEDRPNVDVINGEGSGSASNSGAVEGYGDPLYFPSTDQSLNLAIGADLRDMRAIMSAAARGDAVDWAAATTLYTGGKNQRQPDGALRSLAGLAGQSAADRIIRDGLNGTGRGAGLSDNARRQLVDKGVLVLMYGLATERLALAKSRFDAFEPTAAMAVDEAWATLSGVRDATTTSPNNGLLATALAREDDFRLAGRIARPLESSLFAAMGAAERRDASAFEKALTDSRGYLNTIMYLSVLRYAKVLEADQRASDREFHLAEGWAFFQALEPAVAASSREARNAVENAYTRSPQNEFPRNVTNDVYGALNHPALLRSLGIPEDFRFPTVPE